MAGHELFDDDLGTGISELLADHDVVQARERLLGRVGDDDALAGGETGCLQDHRMVDRLDVLDRGGVVGKVAVLGRRDVVPRHKVL